MIDHALPGKKLKAPFGCMYWAVALDIRAFRPRISGLGLFGWSRYSSYAFGSNIELPIFSLRSPLPNEPLSSSTSPGIRPETFSLVPLSSNSSLALPLPT